MPKRKEGWIPKEQRSMLVCKECKQELPIEMFQKRGKNKKSGLWMYDSRCRICHKPHKKQNWIPSENEHTNKLFGKRKQYQQLIVDVKERCVVCGYDKCKNALDFHHKDSTTKVAGISKMITGSSEVDLEAIINEIEKCVIVCSNCHREHHSGILCLDEYPTVVIDRDSLIYSQLVEHFSAI